MSINYIKIENIEWLWYIIAMKIEAVIFDFDGTLVDSEENYYLADKKLLTNYGIDFTPRMKEEYIGSGNFEMMKRIKGLYQLKESAEELTVKKNKLYLEIAKNNTNVFPEMLRFLESVIDMNFKVAVGSGSSPIILKELLAVTGLNKYFSVVISGEDVKKGKPEPDIFIEVAGRLGVSPSSCVVIEDSKFGVESAKTAGMYCIAVPYITSPLSPSFLKADLLFKNGMIDFCSEKALEWIKKINSYNYIF